MTDLSWPSVQEGNKNEDSSIPLGSVRPSDLTVTRESSPYGDHHVPLVNDAE
jgi:hypothetical protein